MDLIKAESEAKRSNNNILSEELEIEILVRLPVISLLRFKCKSWRSIIRSPFFIQKHLQVCNSTNPSYLLVQIRSPYDFNLESVSILSYDNPLDPKLIQAIPALPGSEIEGSCNGVFCLYNRANGDVVLWNPATRETKVVPHSHIQRNNRSDFESEAVGFCFDVKTVMITYRVVMIHACTENGPMSFQLEVCSLSTDSWRLVPGIRSMDLRLWASGLYVGGMCN
nr:putative F-box protein At3g17480 [Ziziphus jujuba var. spinosa]